MDSASSTTFIMRPPCNSVLQEKLHFSKELLTGQLFLGCYQERIYVEELREDWDVVMISPEETDLHKDINKVLKKWSGVRELKWIGITGPDSSFIPSVYCFWVKLSNLSFGTYWFQINHVKFQSNQIIVEIKCVRKSHAPLVAITSRMNKNDKKRISKAKPKEEASTSSEGSPWEFSGKRVLSSFQSSCTSAFNYARPLLTLDNLYTSLRVACAIFLVIVMALVSLIGHLGEYFLKFIRELTLLVNAFTPIIIQLIDLLTKAIGGFYILLAGFFIKTPNQTNANPFNNQSDYSVTNPSAVKPCSQTLAVDWKKRNETLRQELLPNFSKKNEF